MCGLVAKLCFFCGEVLVGGGSWGVQTLSQAQGDRLAVAAGCTFKWLSMEEALNIFGRYEEYHKTNIADFGLYRREYFALKEYKAHVR